MAHMDTFDYFCLVYYMYICIYIYMHNTHHTFLYITQVGTLLYHYIIFVIYQSMNVYNIHALMEMEHPENFIPTYVAVLEVGMVPADCKYCRTLKA